MPEKTAEEWLDYLKRCIIADTGEVGRRDLAFYAAYALRRFIATFDYLPNEPGSVLELGANPYFLSLMMKQLRPYDLKYANFFHEDADRDAIYEQTIEVDGIVHHFPYREFNVEKDRFPYPDEAFDGVLFCEILEHLIVDPVAALAEVHRILKPGGWVAITTPNFARYDNIVKLWLARNPADQYSGYGAYGRHNREYTYPELRRLVCSLGFEIERLDARPIEPTRENVDWRQRLIKILKPARFHEDNLFCLARRRGPCSGLRPAWLYRSLPAEVMDQSPW